MECINRMSKIEGKPWIPGLTINKLKKDTKGKCFKDNIQDKRSDHGKIMENINKNVKDGCTNTLTQLKM